MLLSQGPVFWRLLCLTLSLHVLSHASRQMSWLIHSFSALCAEQTSFYLQSLPIWLPCPRGRLNTHVLSVFREVPFASSPYTVSHNTVWLWELIKCDPAAIIHLWNFLSYWTSRVLGFLNLKLVREERSKRQDERELQGDAACTPTVWCGKDTCFPQLHGCRLGTELYHQHSLREVQSRIEFQPQEVMKQTLLALLTSLEFTGFPVFDIDVSEMIIISSNSFFTPSLHFIILELSLGACGNTSSFLS